MRRAADRGFRLFDFGRGAKVTGAGFPFYVGDAARLVRALLGFFLEENAKAGYIEVSPPIFVNAASATATGLATSLVMPVTRTFAPALLTAPPSRSR